MSAYELYRCIREDGTSKDWAVRINPDGTITTRWGRTGRKLINIQTRNVDSEILKRSKAKKGYAWVGIFEIDALGRIEEKGHCDIRHDVPPTHPTIRWQLLFGSLVDGSDLKKWKSDVLSTLLCHQITLNENLLPTTDCSGAGFIRCDDAALLLALLMLRDRAPSGVRFMLKSADNQSFGLDLQTASEWLVALGKDHLEIRPLAEALGLMKPRLDLRMAIVSERHCWF